MECLLFLNIICIAVGVGGVASELTLRFVFIIENHERALTHNIARSLKAVEEGSDVSLREEVVLLDRENEDDSYRMLCSAASRGVSCIVDLSWSPWQRAARLAADSGTALVRTSLGSQHLVDAVDQYLDSRNATDAAILVETEAEVDQTLYQLLGGSNLRVWVHAGLTRESSRALAGMRPEPAFYVLLGTADFVTKTYARAVKEQLVRRVHRWTLVLTDYPAAPDPPGPPGFPGLVLPAVMLRAHAGDCCAVTPGPGGEGQCPCPDSTQRQQVQLTAAVRHLVAAYSKLEELPLTSRVDCEDPQPELNTSRAALLQQLAEDGANNDTSFYWEDDSSSLVLRSRLQLWSLQPGLPARLAADWRLPRRYCLLPGAALEPLRMFFRIGTAPAVPWSMPRTDPATGAALLDERGAPEYEGYCIDLIERLAETMDFDYEIVTPSRGSFGKKLPNGTWDGVVGDLMRGEIDMAVAALTMTAEREEVIDFVPPYFEQTGILIVIRKPTRKTSLFKFMTVLRSEVWGSIVAALVLTGCMVWLLDKYSPYSARNNPDAYPYPCREFTLKESFWFALTSFTPQGGGEAPKALSGRTLVAAYWLFVVLMLATFTANLAAFLTVERMQTPVSSLEQLARQSRINYTVVEGSSVHQYFINMKFAEDTLYRVWKEITLNATSDQAQYRVWDYPIREQYGHILLAINASGPVSDARRGFQQVDEHTDADFAFIHDSAEIRYELGRNCNLTEVGSQFAEQPYAVAVQQGSRLQELVSRALLELQKERRLEQVAAKYWNESARQSCPDADESEGITLESLGGVFIATLFGLGLAMLTLAWEVFYYKRKERSKLLAARDTDAAGKPAFTHNKVLKNKNKMAAGVANIRRRVKRGKVNKVTLGDSFKPAGDKPNVSVISVYPKREFRP